MHLLLPVFAAPAEFPEDKSQAVDISSLPTIKDVLVDGLVQELGRHVALGADLVVERNVDLSVIFQSRGKQW